MGRHDPGGSRHDQHARVEEGTPPYFLPRGSCDWYPEQAGTARGGYDSDKDGTTQDEAGMT